MPSSITVSDSCTTSVHPEAHIAFAERVGPIVINRYFPKTEQYPQIVKVEKTETQTTNIGDGWRTDHSYNEAPAMGSILVALETPPHGGITLFANMYSAYDALPDGLNMFPAIVGSAPLLQQYSSDSKPIV